MHPSRCMAPHEVRQLTELPNIGSTLAGYLQHIGIVDPQDLKGADPYALYHELCVLGAMRYDPCVLDVFISIVRFMDGHGAWPWWAYTTERKAHLASLAAGVVGERYPVVQSCAPDRIVGAGGKP